MNEDTLVRVKFLDFLFAEAGRLKEQGMSERESMKMVLQTTFDTTVFAWKESYGSRKMAEHFYRIADEFVTISNEEKVK